MKTTIDDEKMADKISADDKKLITDKCDEATSWLRWRSSRRSRRRWRPCATPSSPSSTSLPEVPQAVCLTWEECLAVACPELAELPLEVPGPALPSRRWTKWRPSIVFILKFSICRHLKINSNKFGILQKK